MAVRRRRAARWRRQRHPRPQRRAGGAGGEVRMAGSEPQQLRVKASEITFAALAWGPPSAPLALCLHGYPDTAWTWRHLGPQLAERGWRVVAPFMRGYAPTELAPDGIYQIGALVRDAIELQ